MYVGQIATFIDPKNGILAAWIEIDGNNVEKVAKEIAKSKVQPCIQNFVVVRGPRHSLREKQILVLVNVDPHEFQEDQQAFYDFAGRLRERGHRQATFPEAIKPRRIYDDLRGSRWIIVKSR